VHGKAHSFTYPRVCAVVPGDVRFEYFGACGKLQATRRVGAHRYHVGKVAHAFDDGAHPGKRREHDLDLSNLGLYKRSFLCQPYETHIGLRASRFSEQCHIRGFHHLDSHVMSHLDPTSHVSRTKDFEAQDGKVVLLREFHNDFVSSSVLRRCRA